MLLLLLLLVVWGRGRVFVVFSLLLLWLLLACGVVVQRGLCIMQRVRCVCWGSFQGRCGGGLVGMVLREYGLRGEYGLLFLLIRLLYPVELLPLLLIRLPMGVLMGVLLLQQLLLFKLLFHHPLLLTLPLLT